MAKQNASTPANRANAPFSNDGKPTNQGDTSTGQGDFVEAPPGPRDNIDEQPQEWNPPQPSSDPTDRTGGNPVPRPIVDSFDPGARGTGSIGNTRSPFKVRS